MNLKNSIRAFNAVCREDADFRRLGRPPGWSIWYHYRGRWHDRQNSTLAPGRVTFNDRGRRLQFEMTDKYLGAFKGVFVDREYDCKGAVPTSPATILDLGANIGFGAIYLSGLFPGARIVAVEPDPRNLPLLRTNLTLNSVSAQVVEAAVGATAGTMDLRYGDNPTCSSLSGTGMHALADAVRVQVLTVPQILAANGWDRIDLLKIDIEGAEDDLLRTDNDWLAKVGSLLVEIHPNTSAERLNQMIGRFGFQLQRLGSGREPVYFATRAIE